LRDFRATLSANPGKEYGGAIHYSFLPPALDVFVFRSRRKSQHEYSENALPATSFACIFLPSESGAPDPQWNQVQDESPHLLLFLTALRIWSHGMGWTEESPALVVRLRPLIKRTGNEREFYYLEFPDGGGYRRAIFWFGEPDDLRAKDPRSHLNRLLWRGFAETNGSEEAWKSQLMAAMRELRLYPLSDLQARRIAGFVVKLGDLSARG
jgi:hypothetical protein